jgi:hypothetical protein
MQAKGSAFLSALEYAGCKYGGDRVKNFFIQYPEFEGVKLYTDLNWYDLKTFINFSESMDKYFGFGDASLLLEIGEYSAKKAFAGSHRLFKDISMRTAISNAQLVFLSCFSAGIAEIKYIRDNKIHFTIKDLPAAPCLGKTICGWIKGTVESIKTKDTTVTELDAKPFLNYSIEWINL